MPDGQTKGADGFNLTRKAFNYLRGPTGWTSPPVDTVAAENDLPEYKVSNHDDTETRMAEMYQRDPGAFDKLALQASTCRMVPLSQQALLGR